MENASYHIEPLDADNRRPGDPESGIVVLYRLHKLYGWTQRKICKTQAEAESFATSIADSMKTTNVEGAIITAPDGERVTCLAYTPTSDEFSEIIAAWNDLTGNDYSEDAFFLEPVTVIVKIK